jgi:hypothetical protein
MGSVDMKRKRLSHESIEDLSNKANLSVEQLLRLLAMPKNTHNNGRKALDFLRSRLKIN